MDNTRSAETFYVGHTWHTGAVHPGASVFVEKQGASSAYTHGQ